VTYNLTVTNNGPLLLRASMSKTCSRLASPSSAAPLPTAASASLHLPARQYPCRPVQDHHHRCQVDSSLPAGTQLTNTATAFTDSPDPNSGNNTASASSTVQTSADVSVTKVDLQDPVGLPKASSTSLFVTITASPMPRTWSPPITLGANLTSPVPALAAPIPARPSPAPLAHSPRPSPSSSPSRLATR